MIKITTEAKEKLKAFLTENKIPFNVRVFLPTAGCGGDGQQLSLTVDQSTLDVDYVTQIDQITFGISKKLQEITGSVTIDFKEDGSDSGFVVDPEKILPAVDNNDCGGCCGCG